MKWNGFLQCLQHSIKLEKAAKVNKNGTDFKNHHLENYFSTQFPPFAPPSCSETPATRADNNFLATSLALNEVFVSLSFCPLTEVFVLNHIPTLLDPVLLCSCSCPPSASSCFCPFCSWKTAIFKLMTSHFSFGLSSQTFHYLCFQIFRIEAQFSSFRVNRCLFFLKQLSFQSFYFIVRVERVFCSWNPFVSWKCSPGVPFLIAGSHFQPPSHQTWS